jgi:hypothetical protein
MDGRNITATMRFRKVHNWNFQNIQILSNVIKVKNEIGEEKRVM